MTLATKECNDQGFARKNGCVRFYWFVAINKVNKKPEASQELAGLTTEKVLYV